MKYTKQILLLLVLSTAVSMTARADEMIHLKKINEKTCLNALDRAVNQMRAKYKLKQGADLDPLQSDEAIGLVPRNCDNFIVSAAERDLRDLMSMSDDADDRAKAASVRDAHKRSAPTESGKLITFGPGDPAW